MVEQPIIKAVIFSIGTFNGTKSKSESWIVSVENAAQISGQNILHIAFSKLIGSPLTSGCMLRDCLPHLSWNDLKMIFEAIFNNTLQQSTQAFACLQQSSDELLEMCLHCARKLLLNIHHNMDMSQILAEGLNYYTVVYGKILINWKTKKQDTKVPTGEPWKIASTASMLLVPDERPRGYSQADFHAPEVPINEIKLAKGPALCFKCGGPYFQSRSTKNEICPNEKS